MSFDDYDQIPPACEGCGSNLELTKEQGWWCQRCWSEMWQTAPTQAEVDKACNAVKGPDLAEARAAHPEWSKASDVTVRALLVIESAGKRR